MDATVPRGAQMTLKGFCTSVVTKWLRAHYMGGGAKMNAAAVPAALATLAMPAPRIPSGVTPSANPVTWLRKLVDKFDNETTKYRVVLNTSLRAIEGTSLRGHAADPAAPAALTAIDEGLSNVETALAAYSTPLHHMQPVARFLAMSRANPDAMRAVRKQLRRVEDIRVAVHNILVDLYYALLALRSELEVTEAETVSFTDDPDALDSYLRSVVA